MPWWFHTHKWVVIAAERSTGDKPATVVLKKCKRCGTKESELMVGRWTVEQLNS